MTTIAWRDGVMAADSLTTGGGVKSRATKLYRLDDGRVVGCAGKYRFGLQFVEALKRGELLNLDKEDTDSFHAIVMLPDGSLVEYEDGRTPIRVEDRFYAIGSGTQSALAAMHCGKTAREAVEIACLVDDATAGPIMSMEAK